MSAPDFNDLAKTLYSDEASKRRYAQNSLIVDVAIALNTGISAAGMNQKTLAEKLGKTEGFVSQVLSGGANITLRTLCDFAYGMNCVVDVALRHQGVALSAWTQNTNIETTVVAAGATFENPVLPNDCAGEFLVAANVDYALAA